MVVQTEPRGNKLTKQADSIMKSLIYWNSNSFKLIDKKHIGPGEKKKPLG